jgi:hypothetical protein
MTAATQASGLLYARSVSVCEGLDIYIPTVGEIYNNERDYYTTLCTLTAVPYDMMSELDDIGVDFTTLDDFGLFLLNFELLAERDMSLLFGDFPFSSLQRCVNPTTGEQAVLDPATGFVIDRQIHWKIATILRDIHLLERNRRTVGNAAAREYFLDLRRRERNRARRKPWKSQLETWIVSLVNCAEFSYTYETVHDLTIYQLNRSLRQIIRRVSWDKLMIGCYAGTVSTQSFDQDKLSWI